MNTVSTAIRNTLVKPVATRYATKVKSCKATRDTHTI